MASRDHRFLSAARFLLARNGLDAESTSKPGELFDLVRKGFDVVVIDGSDSLAVAAQAVAAIEAFYPDVGVIVVVEEPEPPRRILHPLPKWSSLDQLVDEIERVYLRLHPQERPAHSP